MKNKNLHTCDVEKYKAMIENVKQQVLAKEKKSLPKHGKWKKRKITSKKLGGNKYNGRQKKDYH